MATLLKKMFELAEQKKSRQQIALAAAACAEFVFHLIPDDETRPREAINVIRDWAASNATIEQVRIASASAKDAMVDLAWRSGHAKNSQEFWSFQQAHYAASAAMFCAWYVLGQSASYAAAHAAWEARNKHKPAEEVYYVGDPQLDEFTRAVLA